MTEGQFEAAKALIDRWRKESTTYSKQIDRMRDLHGPCNAMEASELPWRNQEGHMAQLRLCAHELEGALGLRKKPQAPASDKPTCNPAPNQS